MPYHIEKSGGGYYVITTATGHKHSEHPLHKETAEAQLRAMEASEHIQKFLPYKEQNRHAWEHHLPSVRGKHSTFGHFG